MSGFTLKVIKNRLFIIPFIALILLLGGYFYFFNQAPKAYSEGQLRTYAEEVFKKCSQEKHGPTCYDREIPKLMKDSFLSMEDAFKITSYVQEKNPAYLYCHVLGHNIAELETKRDPSKWKDVVARCPTTMCNNGCPHGALMEKFKDNIDDFLTDEQVASIKSELADVCEPRNTWNPREIEKSMCYHALGHLNMYITNADLRKSAELCRDIGTKSDGRNYVQTCIEGVFMSIYQPLGPEDIALVKDILPSKEEMPEFCSQFKDDEMSFHACHKEAWAIFREEVSTPKGYVSFCSYTDDSRWRTSCFSSLMNPLIDVKIIDNNDINWLKNFCSQIPAEAKGPCVRASVHRLMQVDPKLLDKALIICNSFSSIDKESAGYCYESLAAFGVLGYIKGSSEFNQYCSRLPKPWDEQCINHHEGW